MDDEKSAAWECCKCVGKCVWTCVQFWTPLTVTFIILWLLYRPDHFHPRIDSGVLAALHLNAPANNATDPARPRQLAYDLGVSLSFRNSHRRLSIWYLDVGATAFYGDTRLGPADDALPAPFHQGPKNTTVLHPAFSGTASIDSGAAAEQLEREVAEGTVHVKVTVALSLMYKVWFVKEVYFYKYDCWLWFPAPPANATTPAAVFDAGTQCWAVK